MPETLRARPEKHQPWLDASLRPYIHIDAVTKQFGEFRAVDRTTLEIHRGELFCLLGASGCGKTTLLRMLAGFEHPTSGRILIDGQDMTGVPAYDRPVNMMFQNYALFPHMSVEQNVAYGLKQDGVRKPELKQRVGEALEMVQLGPWAKRKPHQLSGGQRQRVALARSLVKRPKVLLLDEPLAALDKKLRERTQFELMNIQEELGVTFVVVTHDQEEAMTLSTRMAVMERGQVVQVGTPSEIYEFPATRFTADFIGSINLIEGRVKRVEAAGVLVAAPQLGCDLEVTGATQVREGQSVCVAIRPEKIAVAPNAEGAGPEEGAPNAVRGGARNSVRGTVRDVAYLGDSSVFRVDVGEGFLIEVTQPNLLRSLERKVDWDDAVVLTWRADAGLILTE